MTSLLLLFLFCSNAEAEPKSLFEKAVRSRPLAEVVLRIELARDQFVPQAREKPGTPNRVYIVFNKSLKAWTYVLSDKKGRFPHQSIATGTVLAGTRLGGEPGLRYQFTDNKRWVASNGPEKLRVWDTSKKRPQLKSYLIPFDPKHRDARNRR